MTYNASERKDVRRMEKAAKIAAAQSAEIVRGLMSTTPGRAWVLARLESAHVFATSFDRDAIAMAFNEGERNQGLKLLNEIMSHCPDSYILMMNERNQKELSNERHASGERPSGTDGDGGDQERFGPGDDGSEADASTDLH